MHNQPLLQAKVARLVRDAARDVYKLIVARMSHSLLQGRLGYLCTGAVSRSLVQYACALVHRLQPPAAVRLGATLLRLPSLEVSTTMWLFLFCLLNQLRQQSQVGSATSIMVFTNHRRAG